MRFILGLATYSLDDFAGNHRVFIEGINRAQTMVAVRDQDFSLRLIPDE